MIILHSAFYLQALGRGVRLREGGHGNFLHNLRRPIPSLLTVLGGLAEFERHLILSRTTEGRHRAQQRGVRFGRKPKLTAHQQQEAFSEKSSG
jgi:DNA invertase Pin-like site-specific DNA recombinase